MSYLIAKIGDICEVKRGTTITQKNAIEGDVPVVAGGIKPTYFHNTPNRLGKTITISGSGANAGFVNFWDIPIFASDCSTVQVFRDDVSIHYVHYFLLSKQEFIYKEFRSGAAQPHVYGKDIANIEVPVPPLSTQQKIVAKLDAIFAEIDKATAAAEANASNAEALFQSYLTQVFEKDSNGWDIKFLNQISENLDSKRIPITKGIREEGVIPYYGASGIVDYVKNFIFDGDILLISEDGANLLARTYPIAFSVNGKCWVNNHAHVVKFQNLVSQIFVEFYLNSISLKPFVSGMAQPKLNQAMLNKIPIPFPSLEEQAKLVNLFESIKESSDISHKAYIRKIEELSKLKSSILKQAFSGELVGE